jgi:hypothetical protein
MLNESGFITEPVGRYTHLEIGVPRVLRFASLCFFSCFALVHRYIHIRADIGVAVTK